MQPSIFNVRVPLPERNEVFLMNTLTDAQLLVSPDVTDLLDRYTGEGSREAGSDEERQTLALLEENGFLVPDRAYDRAALDRYFTSVKNDTHELSITLLTTLQCNFACDYCFQGDHGDYNKHADKMSPDTSEQVARWIDARMDELHPKRLTVTFFGGEPLVNLPALYDLAERAWKSTQAR